MMNSIDYIRRVKMFYSFLESEFGFKVVNTTINGNAFYDVEYRNSDKAISISCENIEGSLQTIIFLLEKGKLPNYDDKSKTLHLSVLNSQILSKLSSNVVKENSGLFSKFETNDKFSRKLLKEAKELRLCLKYFNKLNPLQNR